MERDDRIAIRKLAGVIVVITSTTFRSPPDRDAVVQSLLAAQTRAQSEPGVVVYRVSLDPDNPLRVHGLEIYASPDALRNHLNTPYIHELTSASERTGATLNVTAYQGDLEPLELRQVLAG